MQRGEWQNYPVNVELVFTGTIHKRAIFLNYASITCDKGFAYFEAKDKSIARDDNDFRFERIFHRLKRDEGKTVFDTATETLQDIQKICGKVTESVKGTNGIDTKLNYEAILGDHNKDYSIRNRLLKDV